MTKEDIAFILNILRQGTITWKGRSNSLKNSRKQVHEGKFTKDGKEIFKFYWQCASCAKWHRDESDMEVDHIIEIGGFKGDWNSIIDRMYDENNLQVLCRVCHLKKTTTGNATRLYERKKLASK
jgi:5-methylcytosine-specific restriction endonuclease McrA